MLIAKNNRIVSTPERYKCLALYGGHDVYFNSEFGNLWCYRCQSVWKCDPPVVLKEEK